MKASTLIQKPISRLFSYFIFAMMPLFVTSQIEDTRGTFNFFKPINLHKCDLDGRTKERDSTLIEKGIWFEISNECPTGYVIHIYKKNETVKVDDKVELTDESKKFNQKYSRENDKDIYFFISFSNLQSHAYKLRNRFSFTIGTATSIIKIRPGIKNTFDDAYPVYFDFGNDFSLGLLVGLKIFNSRNPDGAIAHNILFGFGTTSISVDSASSKGFANSSSNNSAVFGSFGYVFEYRNFQIGAYMGVDFMGGAVGRNWIYRDRPWFGISMGYSIFKTESPNKSSEQKGI